MKKILAVIIILFINLAVAENLVVTDGDSIKIGSKKIRFYGIDAPEKKQKCFDINNIAWDCGIVAKTSLENLISNKEVNCVTQSIDRYKREVAICYANDTDINQLMVQSGMAIAYQTYSKKYLPDEKLAKKAFKGIWSSAFMEPERYRRLSKVQQ